MKIGILNLPGSNIFSVKYWLKRNGFKSIILSEPGDLNLIELMILPGVGSFDTAMEFINSKKFNHPINQFIEKNKIIIGICCGMQILFNSSEEGVLSGLSVLKGHISRIPIGKDKVPNIGWRSIDCFINSNKKIFNFYFMHSYGLDLEKNNLDPSINYISTVYCNTTLLASFQYNNIYGFQYHPEKSYDSGDKLLNNIINEIKSNS
tara:strand:+ start:120 stop:737 length:618 start_codon:yes stop_codon:yes gene_type:complete